MSLTQIWAKKTIFIQTLYIIIDSESCMFALVFMQVSVHILRMEEKDVNRRYLRKGLCSKSKEIFIYFLTPIKE